MAKVNSTSGLISFTRALIADMTAIGKRSTVKRLDSTLNSLIRYTDGHEVAWSALTPTFILGFETHLTARGLCRNTTSFYLRNLRSILNRAAERDIVIPSNPFRHVYMGVDKTLKRAVPLAAIRLIRDADLSSRPALDFARNLFMFSFYTRGMSFIDMAYLRKTDLTEGVLTYSRRKTRQQLHVRLEPEASNILDVLWTSPTVTNHALNNSGISTTPVSSPYLLPLILDDIDPQREYEAAYYRINRNIQRLGEYLGLDTKLTLYVARHAWASIAHTHDVPLSTISRALGHDSEKTTIIYLRSLDTSSVDRANTHIIRLIDSPVLHP